MVTSALPSAFPSTFDAFDEISYASEYELHKILLESFVSENRCRRRFVQAFVAMDESKLYLKLGFSSVIQYAEEHFRWRRSKSYEFLRVGKKLRELVACDRAFRGGAISWTQLREITRVATAEHEDTWIKFARAHSSYQLEAEVRDALRNGRNKPRQSQYGLPNLQVDMFFRLTPEEHDLVVKAFEKARAEMAESLGEGEVVEVKDSLLYVARQFLATDLAADAARSARSEREESVYSVLYHRCPDCRRATLQTPEGPIEVASEVVDRVEGDADVVVIEPEEEDPESGETGDGAGAVPLEERDPPNSPLLVRKITLRDGKCCSNPFCGRRRHLHAHHIQFRAHGGRTAVHNEVLLCRTCHALVHAGLLMIEGDPRDPFTGEVRFVRRSERVTAALDEHSTCPESRGEARDGSSTAVDSATVEQDGQETSPSSESS